MRPIRPIRRLAIFLMLTGGALVAGCGGTVFQTRHGLPTGAQVIVEGKEQLAWTATRNGHLYLYDYTDRKLVSGFHIRKGQTFSFDPATGVTDVDGAKSTFKVTAGHTHRILFKRPLLGG